MNKLIVWIIALVLIVGGVVFINSENKTKNNLQVENNQKTTDGITKFGEGIKAVVYKEPGCSCCEGYIKELRKQGFNVKVVPTDNLDPIKNKYGIPTDKQSCHTIAMSKYFIEGHVPMKAVRKLLKQKPDIEGIGLPGMPAGAIGMPGFKSAPFKVYQESQNGQFSNYMII